MGAFSASARAACDPQCGSGSAIRESPKHSLGAIPLGERKCAAHQTRAGLGGSRSSTTMRDGSAYRVHGSRQAARHGTARNCPRRRPRGRNRFGCFQRAPKRRATGRGQSQLNAMRYEKRPPPETRRIRRRKWIRKMICVLSVWLQSSLPSSIRFQLKRRLI